jgi:drug/metabolite transporter (DMT)-like permease
MSGACEYIPPKQGQHVEKQTDKRLEIKRLITIKSVMIFSTSSIFGIIFALIFLNEKDVEVWKLFVSSMFMIFGIFLITKESNK